MPVDRNGKKIHTGDIVYVPCMVKGIDRHPDFINVLLTTCDPVYPGNSRQDLLMNSQQVEIKESLGETKSDIDVAQAIQEFREQAS